jgi:16S rRNA (adenine1518-N6/adenine1519-N6)-dimethyltransferase
LLSAGRVEYVKSRTGGVKVADIPDVTSPRVLKELFKRYGLNPRKQLGQNFLIDANIARKILTALDIKAEDAVIEVGPGAGALTVSLARIGADLVALEIDRGLAGLLEDILRDYPQVRIIRQDALKVNWRDLIFRCFNAGRQVRLVSNLPYVISGPFIYALLKERFPFECAVLMLQKEVARRLVASPGDSDYGGLSVLCRYYTEGKVLFDVSANVFWPRPNVGSAVIMLQSRPGILTIEEEAALWEIVQGVFQQRRKTMLNNMIRLFPECSRDQLISLMGEAGIEPAERPEQLSVDRFAKLARIIYNCNK